LPRDRASLVPGEPSNENRSRVRHSVLQAARQCSLRSYPTCARSGVLEYRVGMRDNFRRPRRMFLKQIPATLVASVAMPSTLAAQSTAAPAPAPAAPGDGITSEILAAAQQVAGVSLPAPEREAARPLVA